MLHPLLRILTRARLRPGRSAFTLVFLTCLFVLISLLSPLSATAQARPLVQWMHGGHPLGIKQAVLTQDGKTMVTIGYDSTLKIRRTSDGILMRTIFDNNNQLSALALSPDGTRVVCGSPAAVPLHVYRLSDGALLQSWPNSGGVSSLAWSPDGSKVAVGTSSENLIHILNAADGSALTTLTGHTAGIGALAFSPDGTRLVSGSLDRTVRIWNTADGSLLHTFTNHTDTVGTVAIAPDNRTVASGSLDGTVKLWDTTNFVLLRQFVTGALNSSVAFSPSGAVLATGSSDSKTRLWNVSDGSLLHTATLGSVATPVESVIYSTDGTQLLAAGQKMEFTYYNSGDLSPVRSLPSEHTSAVTTVAVTPNGAHVISIGTNDEVRIWNRDTGALEIAIPYGASPGPTPSFLAMAISPDSKTFATTDSAHLLRIWRISDGAILLEKSTGVQANAIAFSQDGTRIFQATSSPFGIAIRSAADGSLLGTLKGHSDQILALAVSPDGRLLASASMDQTINVWRLSDSTLLKTFTGNTDWVDAVAFSADSAKLLSGSYDNSATLRNVASGAILHTFSAEDAVTSVAIAPDGNSLATATRTHLRLWNLSNGTLLNDYTDEVNFTTNSLTNASTMLTYAADNASIVYGRLDATVAVVGNPYWVPAITGLALSPSTVISGFSSTGTVTINRPAPAGGAVINLQSNNGVAALSAYSLTIPQGATTGAFTINTSRIADSANITITASNSASSATATLNVRPHLPSDFNNDGLSDLVLQNQTTNVIVVWFTSVLNVLGGSSVSYLPAPNWQVVGVGDFNRDGNSDLVLQNQTTGKVVVWYLIGTTVGGGEELSLQPGPGYKVVGVGDFNGDGKPDLLFQKQGTGQLVIWFMSGATMTGGVAIPQMPDPGYNVVGVGDMNADGKPDIIFQNQTTNQVAVWYMNGSLFAGGAAITYVPPTDWKVHAVQDIDGDGKPDLIFQNQTTNQLLVWFMNDLTISGGGTMSLTPTSDYKLRGPH